MPSRVDNARVTARVQKADGTWIDLGYCEDRAGGSSDSSSVVYPMGGIGKVRRALGGRPEPSPVTIKMLYDEVRQAIEGELRARAGKGAAVVNEQPLDDEENAIGRSTTWSGKLKHVTVTDTNQEGNAAKQLECEIIVETVT